MRIKNNIISAFLNKNFNTLNDSSTNIIFNLIVSTIFLHFLFWLLAIDSVGVLEKIYVYSSRFVEQRWLFYPFYDGGYLEHFQVILLFWNFLLTSYIVIKNKWRGSFGIPIIWFLLLIDDFFALHENVLQKIIISKLETIQFITKIDFVRIDDIAEILFWLFFLVVIILILLSGLLSKTKNIRTFIYINIFFYFLIAIPGIFIDVLQVNLMRFINSNDNFLFLTGLIFNTLEEFGEIFFISISFSYFFKNSSYLAKEKRLKEDNLKIYN